MPHFAPVETERQSPMEIELAELAISPGEVTVRSSEQSELL